MRVSIVSAFVAEIVKYPIVDPFSKVSELSASLRPSFVDELGIFNSINVPPVKSMERLGPG